MTEEPQTPPPPVGAGAEPETAAPAAVEAESETAAPAAVEAESETAAPVAIEADDRPELAVGAAFAGGFLAALILKRLGR